MKKVPTYKGLVESMVGRCKIGTNIIYDRQIYAKNPIIVKTLPMVRSSFAALIFHHSPELTLYDEGRVVLRVAAVRGVGEVAQPRAADEGSAARQRGHQPRELLPEAEAAQIQPQARGQSLHVHAADR